MGENRIPAAEFAVLEALWQRQPATIRELTEAVYPDGPASSYATVQKLVERLEQKGYVRRDRSAFVHTFVPAIERAELIDRQLRDVAARLCEGSLTPLLMHLVQAAGLSASDRKQLRKMLDAPVKRPRKESP